MLASAAVLAGGAVWASRQLDELQDRNETKVVAHAVGQVFGMLERNAHDYAWSDDAALRASLALDWASAQVGLMLWTSWGYNYVFAVAEDGSTSYGLVDGRPTDDAAAAHLGPDLDRLIARARVVAGEPVAVSATLAAGERLVAAAAARITWRTPTVASGDLQVMHLVLGKRLDRRLVDELAGHLEIREPRLRAATAADAGAGRWALAGLAGVPVAVGEWAPSRPGARALASLAPPMAAAFAVLLLSACAAGGVLVRADRRRRASEGRFRDFAAAGSDWFWETDAAGRFTFVSGRFAELAELDPASLIGRTRVEAGLSRDSDPASWARLQEEMARHLPVRGFRYPFRTASGRLRHLQISGRPFRDEAGRFLGYRGAGSDVTHEVEAQSALTFLAKHDALTELPNRALLDERLRQDLARAGREGPLAVLRVAERLAGPPRDTAARAAALQGLLRRLPGPAAVEPPLDRHGGHPGDLGAPGNGQAPARGVDVDVAARVAQLLVPGRPLAVPGVVAAARVVDTLDRMLGGRTRAHVL